MTALNHTHDPSAKSWVASANEVGDFPIQNLPFAVFRRAGSDESFRGGVAIGDQVVDLRALSKAGLLTGRSAVGAQACEQPVLNDFFALGSSTWSALRHDLFALLKSDAPDTAIEVLRGCLIPHAEVEFSVPTRIGDYTDFYTNIHHALNVGRITKPDDPLTSNFQWIPIAYHGRVSSIGVSGQKFRRPLGQRMAPNEDAPTYGPCLRLDFELELAIWIGTGNAQGSTIPLAEADEHVFGFGLLNDWSARDIQFWEMAPLGPFLGKNFCTTISPWIVTQEALAPFRLPFERPAGHPQPLPYLDSERNRREGSISIELDVLLESEKMRRETKPASRIVHTNFRHQYWTVGQMVAQHANGGCNLNSGDLFGSGTVSGPTQEEAGAIVELTKGGVEPVHLCTSGESRAFLEDGDAVILRAWCEKPGAVRIGFGESRGEILPAQTI